jgi:hypothetical protein
MRSIAIWATLALSLAACGGERVEPQPLRSTALPSASPSATPPDVTPTPTAELPAGLPATFEKDVDPADLPPSELVPRGAEVTGVWFARTTEGDAVVVAWADPKGNPFRRDGGIAAWRRFDGDPPWRAVFGVAATAEEGVLGVRATTADVTGDGSEDALVVQDTGGTGACGRYMVLDLLAGSAVWERELCDAQVDPSTAPVGLVIDQAVYEPGDAHCCPSAFRRTVLVYDGDGDWSKVSVEETPA